MQRAVVVLLFCITLLVGSLNADHRHLSKHGHRPYHHRYNHVQPAPVCEYQSTNGDTFSLSPLAKLTTDLQFTDASSNIYYYHPCGNVVAQGCPANSAVCMIDANGTPVSFGTPSSVEYSDGVFGESTFEAMYGNGDVCGDEQVPRKVLIEFVCSADELASSVSSAANSASTSAASVASASSSSNSVASAISSSVAASVVVSTSDVESNSQSSVVEQPTSRIVSAETDGCFLTLVVSSPNACDVEDYCKSITEEDACRATSKVCVWKNLYNKKTVTTTSTSTSSSTSSSDSSAVPAASTSASSSDSSAVPATPQGVCQPYRGLKHFSSTMYGLIAAITVITVLSVFLFIGMVCVYYRRKIKGRTSRKHKKSCDEVKMSLINDETKYEEQGQASQEMVEELLPVAGEASAPPVQVAIFFPGQQIPANPYTGYGYQPMSLQWIPPRMDTSSDK